MAIKSYVSIGNNNSKLGKSILSINLPPIKTCRADAPCCKGCYACKGNFKFPNVMASHDYNLMNYLSNNFLYFETIKLNTMLSKFVRWHSSGDIVDSNYFLGMCKVARANKDTKYLCFTKKYEIVNEYLASGKKIPKNLSVVFSNWNEFKCENPYNLPIAEVKNDKWENNIISESAFECGGSCATCQKCWKLKKGESVYFNIH